MSEKIRTKKKNYNWDLKTKATDMTHAIYKENCATFAAFPVMATVNDAEAK